MKTVISSTEHVLLFAKNIHRYTASVRIVDNDETKPFSTLKLSDIQNALAQSFGYRYLHELNKSLSPDGLSSWVSYPKETVYHIKSDLVQRLSMLIGPGDDERKGILRVLVAGALHRDGAKGALDDPADDDIGITMDYTQKPTQRSGKPSVQFAGASGKLITETILAIMEAKNEALRLRRVDLEKELLAAKTRFAKAFILEMSPDGPVTIKEVVAWMTSRLNVDKSIEDKFASEFLSVLNAIIAEQVNTVH